MIKLDQILAAISAALLVAGAMSGSIWIASGGAFNLVLWGLEFFYDLNKGSRK